jgi:hypothetical protein
LIRISRRCEEGWQTVRQRIHGNTSLQEHATCDGAIGHSGGFAQMPRLNSHPEDLLSSVAERYAMSRRHIT